MRETSIVTSRLVLAPLAESDAARLFQYRSDPSVSRFQFFEPESVEDARRFIVAGLSEAAGWQQLGIRLKDGDVLAGDLGFLFPAEQPHQAEIGVTVAPDHQRRGIGIEAVHGLLGHLFGVLGAHRVFASVDPRNAASMALLGRAGMRQEAHFRESLWFKGEWVDDVVFAILESEWERSAGDAMPKTASDG